MSVSEIYETVGEIMKRIRVGFSEASEAVITILGIELQRICTRSVWRYSSYRKFAAPYAVSGGRAEQPRPVDPNSEPLAAHPYAREH